MVVFRVSDFVLKKRIYIYLLSISLLLIYLAGNFDISIPFYLIFWIFIGNIIISNTFKKENRSTSKKIFYLSFFVYVIFMILTQVSYIDNPFTTYFHSPDSASFYKDVFSLSQNGKYDGP